VVIKDSIYIAMRLDGFIAKRNRLIDWFNNANAEFPTGEECGFITYMNSVDTLILGCKTSGFRVYRHKSGELSVRSG
jgi:hypothetical protein